VGRFFIRLACRRLLGALALAALVPAAAVAIVPARYPTSVHPCGWLSFLSREVQAQSGRTITSEQAAQLLARAKEVKTALKCG